MSKRNCDVDKLSPEFKPIVLEIMEKLRELGVQVYLFETWRSKERQEELVKEGRSKTMKSKHLEGRAADFVAKINGQWSWDLKNKKVKEVYQRFGVVLLPYKDKIRWGGDFGGIPGKGWDMPHIEMR